MIPTTKLSDQDKSIRDTRSVILNQCQPDLPESRKTWNTEVKPEMLEEKLHSEEFEKAQIEDKYESDYLTIKR